jgi:predicted esterase
VKRIGTKPKEGYSLFIGLHGGGGCPADVNDSQWENHKKLYKLPEGSIWLAPRAPTNVWNLWHQEHIDRMIKKLSQVFLLSNFVDCNKVYLSGYSAGGDGVYKLAPRLADLFAGAAMMAGHPNGASLLGLRNLPFSIQVGENDTGYQRNKVAQEYAKKLEVLKKNDKKGYNNHFVMHKNTGHWMNLKDKVAFEWMSKFTRDPYPEKIVWKQCSDVTNQYFYWLKVDEPVANTLIVAERKGNTIILESKDVQTIRVRLNDRFVDLEKEVSVFFNGKKIFCDKVKRDWEFCRQTVLERYDYYYTFCAEIVAKLENDEVYDQEE